MLHILSQVLQVLLVLWVVVEGGGRRCLLLGCTDD
jgi:hypothetical protein